MTRATWLLTLTGAAALGACVTINVYFPAAAAEKAADRIIDEVWGQDAGRKPPPKKQGALPASPARIAAGAIPGSPARIAVGAAPGNPAPDAAGAVRSMPAGAAPAILVHLAAGALDLLVPAAAAQANLDISTPAINALQSSMSARHQQLATYYDNGAVGLTDEGLVALRDPKAVPLNERPRVTQLVAEENRDRNALYRAIAEANGHPEWEPDIRATFARRWIERARSGWWYESGGGWSQR